jgi:hypothetical protein
MVGKAARAGFVRDRVAGTDSLHRYHTASICVTRRGDSRRAPINGLERQEETQ